jgi:hypothetical protein
LSLAGGLLVAGSRGELIKQIGQLSWPGNKW